MTGLQEVNDSFLERKDGEKKLFNRENIDQSMWAWSTHIAAYLAHMTSSQVQNDINKKINIIKEKH